ncbi:GDP-mannose 4,6-dehydratase [Brevibacillus sp. TJ4]|uniref:GDP-mannose 4,6-dehydratase n=1 Tax=Brevibacillus sp. TJ4 TaxID=3234853 RepID=UPI0037D33ABA
MKTLITGVAGFLGSHLLKELLSRGKRVVGIDNLSSGRLENIRFASSHPSFQFHQCDVSDPAVLRMEVLHDVREIYHLASPASPVFYQNAPFATIHANTRGTEQMLELARRYEAVMLFASTSEAYGDPLIHPQPEVYCGNVNTWGPRACYDEAKRLGEVLCYEYFHRLGVRVKVARIFNTYAAGLRNDDGRVISNFVTQALTGAPITVYGDGSQTRSFCYVDDCVRALQLMMEKDEATGQVINIGNPDEHAILDLARTIKKMSRSDSEITFHPLPADDPKVRRPVIEKAKRLLGWSPVVSLEEGLERTIKAYREQMMVRVK